MAVSGDNVVAVWNQYDGSYGRIYSNYAAFGPAVITDLGTGGGCFIATTAFGTPLAGQVEILRQFRDRYLLSNSLGRKFVAWYYKNGPAAAGFIQDKPLLKAAVQSVPLSFNWILLPVDQRLYAAGIDRPFAFRHAFLPFQTEEIRRKVTAKKYLHMNQSPGTGHGFGAFLFCA